MSANLEKTIYQLDHKPKPRKELNNHIHKTHEREDPYIRKVLEYKAQKCYIILVVFG
jgi:hypothetical protein